MWNIGRKVWNNNPSLTSHFEMMTSKHRARISRENSFTDEYITSKLHLLLIVIFLSWLVHETRVCVLFLSQFWADDVITTFSQNVRNLKERFPFTINFCLFNTIGTWNTSFDPFWHNFGLLTWLAHSVLGSLVIQGW